LEIGVGREASFGAAGRRWKGALAGKYASVTEFEFTNSPTEFTEFELTRIAADQIMTNHFIPAV
jgi:hypothetical protein